MSTMSIQFISIKNNCRLCYNQPGLYELNSDKVLMKEIYYCTRVKVNGNPMDSLPKSICEECKKIIKNFFVFKQQVKRVDQHLRKLLVNKERECSKTSTAKNTGANIYDPKAHECDSEKYIANLDVSEECISEMEPEPKEKQSTSSRNENRCLDSYLVCGICDEKFTSNKDLKFHKKTHKMKYICKWKNCKKVLNSLYTLKTHELIHEGKRSFLCVTCGKGFITKNSLMCHEKIHLDVKGYTCKLCNIGFSVRSNLRAHEKKYHEGIRFYCSQCTKAFVSKCSLERHERIHTGIKEFQCEKCPSAFYTNKELLKHQRYHQGLRLHKCDECFKTFFERHHLITHVRSHTGERPYVCKVLNCGKSFMESQKLKRHHNAKHAQLQ